MIKRRGVRLLNLWRYTDNDSRIRYAEMTRK
jgi:hypothetical protein